LLQLFHHGLQLRLHGGHPLIGKGVSIGSSRSLLSLQELVDEVCNISMQYDTHAPKPAEQVAGSAILPVADSIHIQLGAATLARNESVTNSHLYCHHARAHHPQTGHTVAGLSHPHPS
jgi:hypothetical protein